MRAFLRVLKYIKHLHIGILFLADALLLFTASLFTHVIISSVIPIHSSTVPTALCTILPAVLCLFGLLIFRVYKIMIKHLSSFGFLRCILGIVFGCAIMVALEVFVADFHHRLFYVVYCPLAIFCIAFVRIAFSIAQYRLKVVTLKGTSAVPTLIIGAGYTGTNVLREMMMSDTVNYAPVGFVDDNAALTGLDIDGVRVLGPSILIPEFCRKLGVKIILFAIPSCPEDRRKNILRICAQTGCEVKVIPSVFDLASQVKFLPQVTSINVEDVLGRSVVHMDESDFLPFLSDKVVMVTGVGSIGSEICRQVVKANVSKLVMVDIYENNAYEIQQELISEGYADVLATEIASVRDYDKMHHLFEKYKPDLVFHAAAHKHVQLMETNPEEAVKNNILGTYNVARLSDEFAVHKMVLISTDKAVNPTNVMGASKRCCEMTMQYMAQKSKKTEFVAVRFGNVLGSNGSVIPLFIKQIEHGGPVTVTHPDIIRYFMTIPEAVSLVLEAGAMAKGGEIFVLDMGEPFKITTLAENIIKLYGYKPYDEMPIKFIGLRPGEKLFEELLMSEEGLKSTENKSIFIGNQITIDEKLFEKQMKKISENAAKNDGESVVETLKEMVPTFNHQ